MQCGTLTALPEGSRPGDNFVSLEFNLVLFAAVTLMLLGNTLFGYLVDVVAGGLLLYGTLVRKQILYESRWEDNFCATSEETVYNFFVYSLVSWVASAIIEFKSCRFLLCKIRLGGYDVRALNKRQFCALILSLFVSANACWVMLQYSTAVHKSFEGLTNDPWLLLYYLMSATAKNSRVFLQGLVYTSWVPEHPWGFIPEKYRNQRMAMGRMGITNFIMLLHAIFLSTFPSDGSMSTMNTISLVVDIAYRIISCIWFLQNGCRHVKPTLLTVLTRITSSYNSIVTRTPEDPYNAAAEADPNIASLILEHLRPEEASEDPNNAHSSEPMLNSNLQATTTGASTNTHLLHNSENQAPQSVTTSETETTSQRHSRADVESPVVSFAHSVEEESLGLKFLSGNALSGNHFFVLYPSNDNSHPECQKLIESHIGHNHNHLELIQPFPNNSDLHTQPKLFHDTYEPQSSEVFQPPQLESNASFTPSSENFVSGISLLDIAPLSTDKTKLVTGI